MVTVAMSVMMRKNPTRKTLSKVAMSHDDPDDHCSASGSGD